MLQGLYYGTTAAVLNAIQAAISAANYQGELAAYANAVIASITAYEAAHPGATVAVFYSAVMQSETVSTFNFNIQSITVLT